MGQNCQFATATQEKEEEESCRPRMDDRKAMSAIFYVLRTGYQWKALPRSLGASSTVHDRFQEWQDDGMYFSECGWMVCWNMMKR